MNPNYITLHRQGKLGNIRDALLEKLKKCDLCPRNCRVNRLQEAVGFCKTGRRALVSSVFCHFGEEPELVGRGGSGTIFFSYCNLGCIYCQNYTLSHEGQGQRMRPDDLAQAMLMLQKQGTHNINFVTPTHVTAQILEALCIAVEKGLCVPLVYNCGGYESASILRLLDGVFDIYMPDIKYSDNAIAETFSHAPDYWESVEAAVLEMHGQVGDLVVEGGVAKKGLLVRHLVLPNQAAGSFKIIRFLKENVSAHTYVNIMDQYRPCFKAYQHRAIDRRPTHDEYWEVKEYARKIGLYRGFE